jgi:DNA-binding transcriptional regulator YiaG
MATRNKQGKAAARLGNSQQFQGNATLVRLRAGYGLDCSALARMLGTSEPLLERWQAGEEQPDTAARARIAKVEQLLKRLALVMRHDFIPTWLETPNDACKEAGARTPLDLMERGDYEQIEDMIFYFESGVPF